MARQAIKDWVSIILMVAIIAMAALGATWFFISIYANIAENDDSAGLADFPDVEDAQYAFSFKATGNIILSNEYEHPSDNLYILHGYWEDRDGKYRYNDGDLILDKNYFGDIVVTRRGK